MNILIKNPVMPLLFFVCSTGVYSETWSSKEPWVTPVAYVPDGKPFLEFTCKANLEPSQWLSWYQHAYTDPNAVTKELKLLTTIKQGNRYGIKTIKLFWPLEVLDNNSDIYCSKEDIKTSSVIYGDHYPILSESEKIPIAFQTINTPSTKSAVQVTPETFEDGELDGVIQFTCWASLSKRDVLSWFQVPGLLLTMVQQENHYGYVKVGLRKTLDPSDNGTNIYCAKASMLEDGSFVEKAKSLQIPIRFQKPVLPLDAYVTKEPSSDIVVFNKGDTLKFTCAGSEPADGRSIYWHLTGFKKSIYPGPDLNISAKESFHRRQLYCAQEHTFDLRTKENKDIVIYYDEMARSEPTTLLCRGCGDPNARPEVTPDIFEDKLKSFIKFTCYAFARPGELLAWYQSKGLNQTEDILLRIILLDEPDPKWIWLSLNKTLEQTDNGTDIYCAKKTPLEYGLRSDGLVSQRIRLKIERDIKPIDPPTFKVTPNGSVYFVANTTHQFACGGSEPVDGRSYTWFKMDADNITIFENQNYSVSTNLNVLKLFLNESYHHNKLFCAQGYLIHIRLKDGSWQSKFYGEVARSNITTLLLQEKNDNTHIVLGIVLPLLLGAVLLAAALWARRRRRAPRPAQPARPAAPARPAPRARPAPAARAVKDKDEEDSYVNLSKDVEDSKKAPTEVIYAVLELSTVSTPGTSNQNTTEPPSEYAVIPAVVAQEAQDTLTRIHM